MNRDLRALGRELRPTDASTARPALTGLAAVGRRLPELLVLAVLAAAWWWLDRRIGPVWAVVVLVVLAAAVLAWPWGRRVVCALFWVRVTRHRLRTALLELRLTNRAGKPPFKLFIRPTPVGERVWLWLRAGVSAEDLTDASEHLRAACWARDVRVTRSPRWSALVTVDVVRRDPLASGRIVGVPLADVIALDRRNQVMRGKGRRASTA